MLIFWAVQIGRMLMMMLETKCWSWLWSPERSPFETKCWSWLWSPEWSPWYQGYRVVGYPWCCARIMGKDQAPCGHLMITTVLFIPSLIWSWDDRVMSEVGKWCMCWLRGNPSRINGAYSVIMLHASIVRLICSCHAHIVLAVLCSCCSCHVILMISW